jgi:hypothetical protein
VQIQDEIGRLCTTNDDIADAFVQYYQHLFTIAESNNIGVVFMLLKEKLARI